MQADAGLPIEVSVEEVDHWRREGADFTLLDCREADEFDAARIEGARLIPMSEIANRLGEIESLRGEHLVVYCHHGGRSLRVARWLRSQGFPRVQSMAGGIDQWSSKIDPTVTRY